MKGLIALIIFCVGLIVLCFWALVRGEQEWQKFSAAHACHITGHMDGSTGVGPSFSGKGGVAVVYIAGKTGYTCDDGVTYWREE